MESNLQFCLLQSILFTAVCDVKQNKTKKIDHQITPLFKSFKGFSLPSV